MLNDNEIKKALECCNKYITKRCIDCPLLKTDKLISCEKRLGVLSLNLINRQNEEYEHLLKIARKMHTWIFLNTGDEQAVYDEIGFSNEDNVLLGYGGQIELTVEEKE